MACLGFVTFFPLPERSFPCFMAFISRSTDCEALGPYFLAELFFAGISVDLYRLEDPMTLLVGLTRSEFGTTDSLDLCLIPLIVGIRRAKPCIENLLCDCLGCGT